MASEVAIANRALDLAAQKTLISSFDEQSTQAKAINRHFAATRDEILARGWWNFAKATERLALLKAAPGTPENPSGASVWDNTLPMPPWSYEYAYPDDCLKVRYIEVTGGTGWTTTPLFPIQNSYIPPRLNGAQIRFAIGNSMVNGAQRKVILTSQAQAVLAYTRRITNTELWDQLFEEAFVQALASKIAGPLTGNTKLVTALWQQANATIQMARVVDGNEGLNVHDPMPDWLAIRGMPDANLDGTLPYPSLT